MSIHKKLLEIQKEMPIFSKDAHNPHFNKKYADLSGILKEALPILNKHGVIFSSEQKFVEGLGWVMDVKLIDAETSTSENTLIPLLNSSDMQRLGSAKTYARRYGLLDLLGGCAGDDDDDGNKTIPDKTPPKKDSAKAPPPPKADTPPKKDATLTEKEIEEKIELNKKIMLAYNNNSALLTQADKERAEAVATGVVTQHKDISILMMKNRLAWIEKVIEENK